MGKQQNYYESNEFFDALIDNVCPELGEKPCGLAIAPFGYLPQKQSFDLGRAKALDDLEKKFLQQPNTTNPPSRSDKGKKHRKHPKRSSDYGKTAKIVAKEFSYATQTLEKGAKRVGTVSEGTIKQWDIKFPDSDRRNKWGYYAQLRLSSKNKQEYQNVLQYWAMYWLDYKRHFLKWRKQHPASKRSSFRFTPHVRINNFHPEWIGRDDKGEFYNTPNNSTIDK